MEISDDDMIINIGQETFSDDFSDIGVGDQTNFETDEKVILPVEVNVYDPGPEVRVPRLSKERKRQLKADRIEKTFTNKVAFLDFTHVMNQKRKYDRERSLRGALDETSTLDSNLRHDDIQLEVIESKRVEYIQRRQVEVKSLYDVLGVSPTQSKENCFGSYSDIAREAYQMRETWPTNQVTVWLRSLGPSANKWGEKITPYKAILPYLPIGVQSYLDYGCGSGFGSVQVSKYLGGPSVSHVFDVKNELDIDKGYKFEFQAKINRQYDLVTMVNVMHHVYDIEGLMMGVMESVEAGGLLIIKDHFPDLTNVCLAVLVHEMYEPTPLASQAEPLYFRELKAIINYIRYQGWTVDIKRVPLSDINDCVLICRNSRDGGISQLTAMEKQISDLTQAVQDLKVIVTQRVINPDYIDKSFGKKSKLKGKTIVERNDLRTSADSIEYKKDVAMAGAKKKDFVPKPIKKYPTGKKSNYPREIVTTEFRPKAWKPVELKIHPVPTVPVVATFVDQFNMEQQAQSVVRAKFKITADDILVTSGVPFDVKAKIG
jgi:hypothetical protein